MENETKTGFVMGFFESQGMYIDVSQNGASGTQGQRRDCKQIIGVLMRDCIGMVLRNSNTSEPCSAVFLVICTTQEPYVIAAETRPRKSQEDLTQVF